MTDNPWMIWKILQDAAITVEPIPKRLGMMYRRYNRNEGQICGTCKNLYTKHYDKSYFKCALYKDTNGAGTDWRKKWIACGRWEQKDE